MNLKETLKLEAINRTKERVVGKTKSRRFVQRLVVEREREEDYARRQRHGLNIYNQAATFGGFNQS